MPVFCIVLEMNVLKKLRMRLGSKIHVSSGRLLMIHGYEDSPSGHAKAFLNRIF